MDKLFRGRTLVIATKHGKEKIIAPLLEQHLGVKCVVPEDFDSDQFGTFTGEIERLKDPVETARQKCEKAMAISGCDLALASEGSFGLHPSFMFVHADSEIILLMAKKHQLEFAVREISTHTNFNGAEIKSYDELQAFAETVMFPSHALILRKSRQSPEDIHKGITDTVRLKKISEDLLSRHRSLFVETDMRAMHNPTRMEVIEKTVHKLLHKLNSSCPRCTTPGFSLVESKSGLLCENCSSPTRSTLSHVLSCQSCGYQEEKLHPHGKAVEDPMYCDVCNP